MDTSLNMTLFFGCLFLAWTISYGIYLTFKHLNYQKEQQMLNRIWERHSDKS